jgi:excisionase family DNA binding protein
MTKTDQRPPDLYTIAETCEALHISRMTYYKLVRDGELPTLNFGRAVRIHRADIDALIAARSGNGGHAPRQRKRRPVDGNGRH